MYKNESMVYTGFMSMSSKTNAEHIQNILTAMPLESIKLLSCERFDVHSSIWNFERHSHDFYEFLYFIDGKARIETGKDMDINILTRSEERRVGKSVDLGGRRIIKKKKDRCFP